MSASTSFKTIFAGCGLAVVVSIVSCAGLLFYFYRDVDKNISPRIDQLFATIDNNTFGQTYLTDTTPELRTVTTRQQYEQIGDLIRSTLGRLKSKSLTKFFVRQNNEEHTADVVYQGTFEKGTGTITATLQNLNGKWLFKSFTVNSPLFPQKPAAIKCAQCGQEIPADANFCPHCGEQLVQPEKESTEEAPLPAST